VRLAIQDQATIGSFYKGTNVILEEQMRAEGFSGEHLQAEKDRMILKATLIYLKTLHPALMRVIWKDFLRGFTETSNFSLAIDPFAENSNVGKYRADNPNIWIPLNVLSSTFLPESDAWYDRSLSDVYLKGRAVKGFGRLHLSSALFFTLLSLWFVFLESSGCGYPSDPGAYYLDHRDRRLCGHDGLCLFYDPVRVTPVGFHLNRAQSSHRRAV